MRIHKRIQERHPELSTADVEHAWKNYLAAAIRKVGEREVRIGFDLKGRELEMVGVLLADGWLIYHAMTPPSKKTYEELARAKGGER